MTNSSLTPGSPGFASPDSAGDDSHIVLEETVIEELVIVNDDGTVDDVIIVGEIDSDAGAGAGAGAGAASDANTWTEGSDDDPEVIPGTTQADIQAP